MAQAHKEHRQHVDDEQHNKDKQPKNPTKAYAGCKTKQGREGALVEMQHRVDQEKQDVSDGMKQEEHGWGHRAVQPRSITGTKTPKSRTKRYEKVKSHQSMVKDVECKQAEKVATGISPANPHDGPVECISSCRR